MAEVRLEVLANIEIARGIFRLDMAFAEKAPSMRCGQFINIAIPDSSKILRRPFGILAYSDKQVSICYQIVGSGTRILSGITPSTMLTASIPLGNGFNIDNYKRVALVGGGVGIFPLASVPITYPDKIYNSYIGFRNIESMCMVETFKKFGTVAVATDDGSFGNHGNAITLLKADIALNTPDVILSCGPRPMFRALKTLMEEYPNIPCFFSQEERMGCGVGACLVCTCATTSGDRKRVCKDGPVFDIRELEL